MVDPNGPVVQVPVGSAWASKINWTQAVAVLSSILVLTVGPQAGLDATAQAAIVTTITIVQGALTWIFKTWFTNSVHPGSIK